MWVNVGNICVVVQSIFLASLYIIVLLKQGFSPNLAHSLSQLALAYQLAQGILISASLVLVLQVTSKPSRFLCGFWEFEPCY